MYIKSNGVVRHDTISHALFVPCCTKALARAYHVSPRKADNLAIQPPQTYTHYYDGVLMQSRAIGRGQVTLHNVLNAGVFPKHLVLAVGSYIY